ncbi:MAG: hypothetical protein IPJ82_04010 [Lewinellaceae bacterium]|nr:hypothetical protein [Lewinellaceae bacterium]
MFTAIFRFELKYWSRNPSVYIYLFVFWVLAAASMAGAAGIFGDGSAPEDKTANSPMSLFAFIVFFNKLALFILPAVIGNALYRDYKSNVYRVLYCFPFTKRDYLPAKFSSAFVVVSAIAFAAGLGLLAGTQCPGVNAGLLAPFDAGLYLQLYLIYFIPNLLIFSVFVFAVVVFSRNINTGFIVIVLVLIAREMVAKLAGGMAPHPAALLLEPLGESATYYYTRHWTAAMENGQPIPVENILIFNRLLWLIFATLVFLATYRRFSFSQTAASFSVKSKDGTRVTKNNFGGIIRVALPRVNYRFSGLQQLQTAWKLSNTDFRYIVRSGSFLSILVAGSVFVVILLLQMNPANDVRVLPLTWVMLSFPVLFFSFLINFMTFLYAGILVHRAKIAGMRELIDVTPVSNRALLFSKFLALVKMQVLLLSVVMAAGIAVQLSKGYYHVEIGHYLFDLFGIHLIGFVIWAFAAIFIQTVFSNPYLGLFFLIMAALGISELPQLGIESLVFRFNQNPENSFFLNYSDMTGYGYFLRPYFIYKVYWLLFGVFLFAGALLFWPRGLTQTFKERLFVAGKRLKGSLALVTAAALLLFAGMGYGIYREENSVHGKVLSAGEEKVLLAQFREKYAAYAGMAQPRITSVLIRLNIYPESNDFYAEGEYRIVNKSGRALDTLLLKSGYDEITEYRFDQKVSRISEDVNLKFTVFRLAASLMPGDSMTLRFSVKNKPNTLFTQNSHVLQNGTFLMKDIFPRLGYFAGAEKNYPSDSTARNNHYQAIDSDLIDFEAIVSTSAEQTAITPGTLQKEWAENGRRYFHYKMEGKTKYLFGFNSARYETLTDSLNGIELKINYHKGHSYCLEPMMRGLKSSLVYNTRFFGPYQHKQARIIEFPLTEGSFGTTSANCIPISERRFIADTRHPEQGDIDISFYIAAHELAHQWWGNQVLPADTRGALMLTESLAEYISARVYEKEYGKKNAARFLRIQLERYLKGRAASGTAEQPLMYVHPDEQHIAYGKGAIAFYTLSEYIGEERLNAALKKYLEEVRFQGPPYATSLGLIGHLRAATPDSLQYLVKDLFETVTFYDNKMRTFTTTPLPGGRHQVDIEFEVVKYRLDNRGNKTVENDRSASDAVPSLPLADYVEIGIFAGDTNLYLKKHKISKTANKMSVVVDHKPDEVGVDPFLRLIDANPGDNKKSIWH